MNISKISLTYPNFIAVYVCSNGILLSLSQCHLLQYIYCHFHFLLHERNFGIDVIDYVFFLCLRRGLVCGDGLKKERDSPHIGTCLWCRQCDQVVC